MCTVTVIPLIDHLDRRTGLRLACNRDERRSRPRARPPTTRVFGERRAILPIDPVSDGTWIGVNDAGLAATLLNVNPLRRTGTGERADDRFNRRNSRGTLVPAVLCCENVAQAVSIACRFRPADFPPFRLVLLDDHRFAELRSDGATLSETVDTTSGGPMFFTSSGLGDDWVDAPRRALFEEIFTGTRRLDKVQAAFHRHVWPDRTHMSVCMSRSDAHTVSHTIVDLEPTRVTLSYLPHAPDQPGEPTVLHLLRRMPE